MRRIFSTISVALLALASASAYSVKVGDPAPNFTGTDSNGKKITLAEFKNKYVVLEWSNPNCPYTRKHYSSGNMQSLQKEWTAKGVVWLSVLSSAPGQQGNVTAFEENEYLREMKAAPTAAILDPSGTIGRLYDAKTTPDMFVIDPQGKIVYEGAIDDQPTPDPASLKDAKNYVSAALEASMAGRAVAVPVTRSYGCSVKYGN